MQGNPDSPYCNFCQSLTIDVGDFCCGPCREKISALMVATKALEHDKGTNYEPSIQFKNVKLATDYPGEAVVVIDPGGAAGVQKPFKFDGQGKCIICTELTNDSLVCRQCAAAINLARQIGNDGAGEFLHLFQDEGFIALLKFVASNAVRKYMEAEIDDLRKS